MIISTKEKWGDMGKELFSNAIGIYPHVAFNQEASEKVVPEILYQDNSSV